MKKIHTICKEILLTLTQLMKQSYNPKMPCDYSNAPYNKILT